MFEKKMCQFFSFRNTYSPLTMLRNAQIKFQFLHIQVKITYWPFVIFVCSICYKNGTVDLRQPRMRYSKYKLRTHVCRQPIFLRFPNMSRLSRVFLFFILCSTTHTFKWQDFGWCVDFAVNIFILLFLSLLLHFLLFMFLLLLLLVY